MLHNLMQHICTFDNLYQAYKAAAKGKRFRAESLQFRQDLEANLFQLQQELLNGTYKVGSYKEFYIHYPKPRLVMALHFRDRVVQHAIYRQVNPYLEKRYIFDSYACRKEKGVLAAVDRVQYWEKQIIRKPDGKQWYYLKIDIAKFFYRVDHQIAVDLFKQITDDQDFIRLISHIINNQDVPFGLPEGISASDCPKQSRLYDVGMPIGNLSSQMIANMYLDVIDQYCKKVLHIHYYIRYMDDIIILHNDLQTIHRWRNQIQQIAWQRLRLKFNRKTAIRRIINGMEFVGRIITPSAIRIRKSSRQRMKRVFSHLARQYTKGNIGVDDLRQTVASYNGIMLHTNSHNLKAWLQSNITFCRNPHQPPPLYTTLTPPQQETNWWQHLTPPPNRSDYLATSILYDNP